VTAALDDRFGPFDGQVWLNCAHQGPLPAPARNAALKAVTAKVSPAAMADQAFSEVPARLRRALARLVGASVDDLLLANSTTYTLNVVAEGLSWRPGDEVVCVAGDFPATVVPWRALERKGVRVRLIGAGDGRVNADAVVHTLGPRTRVVCISWVFSFFGHAVDIAAIGRVCRERRVWFVVNGSQAVGARALDLASLQVDALACCGFKWLCGPYATGFGWLRPELRAQLDYPQPHWLRAQTARGLNRALDYSLPNEATASALDVFCNANFFNFMPLTAAVELLLEVGIEHVAAHDQLLVDELRRPRWTEVRPAESAIWRGTLNPRLSQPSRPRRERARVPTPRPARNQRGAARRPAARRAAPLQQQRRHRPPAQSPQGGPMSVLIWGSALSTPELRHEVPVAIYDPLLYLEHDSRIAVVSPLDASRLQDRPELEVLTFDMLGLQQLLADGRARHQALAEVIVAACRKRGISAVSVPARFPLETARALEASGISVAIDRELFEKMA